MQTLKVFFIIVLLCGLFFSIYSAILYASTTATNNREWTFDQQYSPQITFTADGSSTVVKIENVRNFDWSENGDKLWQDFKFELQSLKQVKVAVSHFSAISEIAHVFLIFVLEDGREFGLSIEARREKGESYSLMNGLQAKYEMLYLIATTDDLLGVRLSKNETLYVYPVNATPVKVQQLFAMFADKIAELDSKPELYHLFFRNCTNQLVKQVSNLSDDNYPWLVQNFMPGKTGQALFKLGLIDTKAVSFKETQQEFRYISPSTKPATKR